jgi:hypothetical protein
MRHRDPLGGFIQFFAEDSRYLPLSAFVAGPAGIREKLAFKNGLGETKAAGGAAGPAISPRQQPHYFFQAQVGMHGQLARGESQTCPEQRPERAQC